MYCVKDLIRHLESLAPSALAEKWDNVGLMVGSKKACIHKVLCALDITEEVIQEAIKENVDCIVTHHPFLFAPLKQIDYDTAKGRMLRLVIKENITVYSMHTNLDIAQGGINDVLARLFELQDIKPLQITEEIKLCKLAIYVPISHVNVVRNTLMAYNACKIGNYKGCTFSLEGEGTFVPLEGSEPYIGEEDCLEKVAEKKVECLVRLEQVEELMRRVKAVHPYEEIAYDVYELENIKDYEGLGRYGTVEPIALKDLALKIKSLLQASYVRIVGDEEALIESVALCSGSGSDYIKTASKVAQVFVTGDVKFHEAQAALEQGLFLIDVGHYASENIMMPYLKQYIEESLPGLEVQCSKINGEMFQIL